MNSRNTYKNKKTEDFYKKISPLKADGMFSKNNLNSIDIGKNHGKKVSVQGLPDDKFNIELSNQNISQQKKIVFKNKSHFLNLKNVIPKVQELVAKQNYGDVEKVIVYVDKDENWAHEKNSTNRNSLEKSQIFINGTSLDQIVSLVADKVVKLINLPNLSGSSSSDSKLSVKVVQPVAHGTQVPHEKTETEFITDLSKFRKFYNPNYSGEDKLLENRFMVQNRDTQLKSKNARLGKNNSSENKKNDKKRLIHHKNRRKINLPLKPFKRRRFWYEKIKRDEALDKEKAEIRRDITKKLNKKFREDKAFRFNQNREEFIRDKRKISNEDLENVNKIKSYDYSPKNSNDYLHKKWREAKVHSKLRRGFSNRKNFSKKLGMVSKMKGYNSKLGISNLEEEAQKKILKEKRMIQGKSLFKIS